MKKMTSYLFVFAVVTGLCAFRAVAQESALDERFEFGLGSGNSNVIASDAFKTAASKGDNQSYWLGYGFDQNWGLELGLDHFDFDTLASEHQAVTLSATYRFMPTAMIHPIAKFGLGSIDTKEASGDKTNSLGAKIMAGAEVDFKYASLGGGVNYHYISKVGPTEAAKNAQIYVPFLFVTFHNDIFAPASVSEESDSE